MAETERARISSLGNATENEMAQRIMQNENEELDKECGEGELFQSRSPANYNFSATKLKDIVTRRMNMEKFSEKRFFCCMLMDDDFIHGRNRRGEGEGDDNTNGRHNQYKLSKVDSLKKLCTERKLPSDFKKESLVFFSNSMINLMS